MTRIRTTAAVVGALMLCALIVASLSVTDTAARSASVTLEDASAELALLGAGTITSVSADCEACVGPAGQCSVPDRYPEICGTVGGFCLCSWCGGDWGCYTPI